MSRRSFLYFFCLLSGYYVLRPVREAMAASADLETVFPPVLIAWFASHGIALKDFVLQFLFSCVFVIMLVLQPVYGWLVSRFPRRVFLPAVYGFFIVTLLGFYVLFDSGVPGRGMAFFSGSLSSTCSRWRCSGASWPMCFPTRRHVLSTVTSARLAPSVPSSVRSSPVRWCSAWVSPT